MWDHPRCGGHNDHAFASFAGTQRDGLCLVSRRNMMKAGLAGIAGLTLPGLMRYRAEAATAGESVSSHRSVILLWMTGGPSQLDTFDLKPGHANGGEFKELATRVPGVRFSNRPARNRPRTTRSAESAPAFGWAVLSGLPSIA